ncbi:MAG: sugar transferase, partial [Chloroflexota bacterium]
MAMFDDNTQPERSGATDTKTTATNAAPPPSPPFDEPLWWLPMADVAGAIMAFLIAYIMRYQLQLIRPVAELNQVPYTIYVPYTALFVVSLLIHYASSGLYRKVRNRSLFEEISIVANGITNAVVVIMAVSFFVQVAGFSRLMLVYVAVMGVVILGGVRVWRRWMYAYLRSRRGIGLQRVVIVGAGEVGQTVLRVMLARRQLGYRPVGYLDDNPNVGEVMGSVRGLGTISQLSEVIEKQGVDLVVITLPWTQHNQITSLVEICQQGGVEARVVPDVFQLNMRQVQIENLDGIPLLGVHLEPTFHATNRILKRMLDLSLIIISAPALIVVCGLTALAIKFDGTGGPVLYKQERVGENGKRFFMYKFRSMVPGADRLKKQLAEQEGQDLRFVKLVDDPRIT